MKRLLSLLLLLAMPVWAQVPTMQATVSFQDPNTGAQAVDGVNLRILKDGIQIGQTVTLPPGTLTYVTVVMNDYPGSHQICAEGIPFNAAGSGPFSSDCKTTVAVIKVVPGQLIQFQIQLQ